MRDIFQRVLRLHQRARRHVEEVDQPRQQEAQRRAARQQRQRILLGVRQLALAAVGVEQRARLGDVEGTIDLEAPGVEADRDVIGEDVVAGEREVDQPRQPLAEEEHVVRKQVGMDHAVRQIARPARFEMVELAGDEIAQARLHAVGARGGLIEQRPPAGDRQRVLADQRKVAAGKMHLRQRLADAGAMRRVRPPRPHAFEEVDDRGRPPRQRRIDLAFAVASPAAGS